MSDDELIQRFKVALTEDIRVLEVKLNEAMGMSLEEYPPGEIFMNQAQAKHSKIKEVGDELHRLYKMYRTYFPSSEQIRGVAEDYLWKKERKVT